MGQSELQKNKAMAEEYRARGEDLKASPAAERDALYSALNQVLAEMEEPQKREKEIRAKIKAINEKLAPIDRFITLCNKASSGKIAATGSSIEAMQNTLKELEG